MSVQSPEPARAQAAPPEPARAQASQSERRLQLPVFTAAQRHWTVGEVLAVAPLLQGQRPSASTENAAAHVRLLLPEPDLPRLRTSQDVRLFLTAYHHQRHGTLRTQLTWISPTPQATAGTAQFFALAAVPAFDEQMPVRIGMTGEARVLTGRRTVLELAMEPLRALRERQFR